MALHRISSFHDVPLLYDRAPAGVYGVTGAPYAPWIDKTFSATCDKMFGDLLTQLPQAGRGAVTGILSGGVGRSGSGTSYHHRNRAFDLDGLTFADGPNWTALSFPDSVHLYLGIEAITRKYFGTVLTFDYNTAHQDHLHFDDGLPPRFSPMSKSRVLFLQNALTYVFDLPTGIDGVYGPETQGTTRILRQHLGLGGLSKLKNWMALLQITADHALARAGDHHRRLNA